MVGVAVEAYLRDDIPCGSSECLLCTPKTPWLAPNASHYVVPDAEALHELLEVFELPAFSSFVLLTSVLRKVRSPQDIYSRFLPSCASSIVQLVIPWEGRIGLGTFV